MEQTIPIQIFLGSLSIIGVLATAIYQNLNDKIKKIEKQVCEVPTIQIKVDIADMKNDIAWLKRYLQKEHL